MSISIPSALEVFASVKNTVTAFAKWRQATVGNAWTLIDELKKNSMLFWSVINRDIPVGNIVDKLSTDEYDRLCREGFNFNSIRQRRIYPYKSLFGTDLAFLGGKETKVLIKNIYDRIKDLKEKYPYANDGKKKRWYTRVVNIQKRILLLLRHVGM
jgi:hypothetical protein